MSNPSTGNEGSTMQEKRIGVSVVIPCLNEAHTIQEVIKEAWAGLASLGISGEVIVVDNGSADDSIALAEAAGARVLREPRKGYGATVDAAIRAADYSVTVFADADLSYPLSELGTLVTPLLEDKADFVLGSRLRGSVQKGAMPFLNRYVGTPVLNMVIRLLYSFRTSDCNSGMRALRTTLYPSLRLKSLGMEYASEMLIRVAQRRLRYAEVPITFRPDARGRRPHLRRWHDGWRHLRFIIGNAQARYTVAPPLLISFSLLLCALVLSFQEHWVTREHLNFHTAFLALAGAVPFSLFALAAILLRGALHASGLCQSRLLSWFNHLSENSVFFLLTILCFFAAGLEALWLGTVWIMRSTGPLFMMGSLIRIMIESILGSLVFSLDLGLAVISLTTQHQWGAEMPRNKR